MVKNLKLLRQTAGVSQPKIADVVMVSQQSINKYENHNVEPDIETLIKIADFFDVSVDYLVGRNDIKEVAGELNLSDLSEQDRVLVKKFGMLTDKQKECVMNVIESYL